MIPVRRITTKDDLSIWIDSPIYNEVVSFIESLQNLVLGKPNDEPLPPSPITQKLLAILERIDAIIDENPVLIDQNSSRFGKVEFKQFYDQITTETPLLIKDLSLNLVSDAISELATYLNESWGNRLRIDYGSGHELNFILFLLCLHKLKIISDSDYANIILQGFTKYMTIMRKLQKTFWLEPAGSHGVWGLDDYHFLPFLFGASQLAPHKFIKPKLIHNDEIIEEYYKKYMYFECIHFINSVKTIPNNTEKLSLRWHSPMLDDILAARNWTKIKEGMIKMYKAEVLQKLPIVQHLMFGSIIQCPQGISEYSQDNDDDHDHHHFHENTWGDCCGIKVPSAIAASELIKFANKPIPFD